MKSKATPKIDHDPKLEDIILAAENGQNILLHGPGGTGKSHIVRALASHFTRQGKIVRVTATTGIAAINLSVPALGIAGSTLHAWAGVGLGDAPPEKLAARVRHDERSRKRWLETDILIIDEVSMLGASFFDKLDFVGRNIRKTPDKAFGGLQIIFSGDFLQLPPVNDKWAFQGMIWPDLNLTPFILETSKRYKGDDEWFNLLLRVRRHQFTPQDIKFLQSRVKAYQDYLLSPESKDDKTVKPTMLYSRKIDVEYQNDVELQKLPGSPTPFPSYDDFVALNKHAKADHYMKPLDDAIPNMIQLKPGAQVMLKANLDIKAGLANGSRGVVLKITGKGPEGSVEVKWVNGSVTTVTAHTWMQEDKDGKATRTQIPLILAWSLTVHRCQGSTLDFAICDLGPSVFMEGQAYVAVSRVTSSKGLFLLEFYPPSLKTSEDALAYVDSLEIKPGLPVKKSSKISKKTKDEVVSACGVACGICKKKIPFSDAWGCGINSTGQDCYQVFCETCYSTKLKAYGCANSGIFVCSKHKEVFCKQKGCDCGH